MRGRGGSQPTEDPFLPGAALGNRRTLRLQVPRRVRQTIPEQLLRTTRASPNSVHIFSARGARHEMAVLSSSRCSDTRHVRRNFRNSADGGRTRRDTSVRPRVARVLLKGPSSACTGSNTILALRCGGGFAVSTGKFGGGRKIARSPRYLGNSPPALSAAKGSSGRGHRWTGSSPRFATKHSGTEATNLTHLPLSLQRLHKSKHHPPPKLTSACRWAINIRDAINKGGAGGDKTTKATQRVARPASKAMHGARNRLPRCVRTTTAG